MEIYIKQQLYEKNIKRKRSIKLKQYSDSGSKITLQIKCLTRAALKLTRYFTAK